jgi:hypothetical protein
MTESPIRSIGVRAADLVRADCEQMSFSPDIMAIQREETLEGVVDGLRKKFGNPALRRGIMFTDDILGANKLSNVVSLVCGE